MALLRTHEYFFYTDLADMCASHASIDSGILLSHLPIAIAFILPPSVQIDYDQNARSIDTDAAGARRPLNSELKERR